MKKICVISLCVFISFMACNSSDSSDPECTLTKVDIKLGVGVSVSGTITLELRDADGNTPALWSNTVDTDTLTTGVSSYWTSFIVPNIELTAGQVYRIYINRSDAHDPAGNNYINWSSTSTTGDDEYPQGLSSSSSSNPNVDFTFRTYDIDDMVDQFMETTGYSYSIYPASDGYQWQEFIPSN